MDIMYFFIRSFLVDYRYFFVTGQDVDNKLDLARCVLLTFLDNGLIENKSKIGAIPCSVLAQIWRRFGEECVSRCNGKSSMHEVGQCDSKRGWNTYYFSSSIDDWSSFQVLQRNAKQTGHPRYMCLHRQHVVARRTFFVSQHYFLGRCRACWIDGRKTARPVAWLGDG